MNELTRRGFLAGSSALTLMASSGLARANSSAVETMRLLPVEEAYAPVEFIQALLKMAESNDTMVNRYIKMYYQKAGVVDQLSNIDSRLAHMDKYGIDMQLLSVTSPGPQGFDAEHGADLSELINNKFASIIKAHPTRFAALAAIAPQSPERAAKEVKRAITELGLNGILINSHIQGEYLDDPKFAPVLEAAVEYNAPIYLHPSYPPDSMIENFVDYGMMGALWGFQAECSLHVARMLLGGVFDRHPKLQVVLGHLGEGLPYWLSRMDNRYQNIRRRGGAKDLGMPELKRLPGEYFRDNFYVATSGMNWFEPFEYCIRVMGPDRVLFAVDYPYERAEDALGFIHDAQARLPADIMHKVTHGNAERIFNIAPAAAMNFG